MNKCIKCDKEVGLIYFSIQFPSPPYTIYFCSLEHIIILHHIPFEVEQKDVSSSSSPLRTPLGQHRKNPTSTYVEKLKIKKIDLKFYL